MALLVTVPAKEIIPEEGKEPELEVREKRSESYTNNTEWSCA